MQITYKKIPRWEPHCGECGEQLQGDNSQVLPFKCSCGVWQYDRDSREYKLIKVKLPTNKQT